MLACLLEAKEDIETYVFKKYDHGWINLLNVINFIPIRANVFIITFSFKVNFRVIVEVDARVTTLDFDMEVNSTNPEEGTQFDNIRHLGIGVVVKAILSTIGWEIYAFRTWLAYL